VALARAIVVEPRVLLLDEPLSNLDAKIRQRLRVEVRRLQRRVGTTTIYVTHDQEEALAIADRVVLMNRGAVVQVGTPEEVYLTPATEFVADFLGVGNRVEGRAEAGAVHVEGQRLPYGGPARGAVLVILRSSDLRLAPSAGAADRPVEPRLAGRLEESLFLGAYYRHYVRVGAAVLMVDGPAPAAPGPVTITVPPDRVRVYPAA
jgi:putative spermidine/putrescine transport system ATP-binding protein